jgi:hypothetical protein
VLRRGEGRSDLGIGVYILFRWVHFQQTAGAILVGLYEVAEHAWPAAPTIDVSIQARPHRTAISIGDIGGPVSSIVATSNGSLLQLDGAADHGMRPDHCAKDRIANSGSGDL